MRKRCVKCADDKDESDFYKRRHVCIECFKKQVHVKRAVYRAKPSLEPVPETIKTAPWKSQVNHELYQHLLRL